MPRWQLTLVAAALAALARRHLPRRRRRSAPGFERRTTRDNQPALPAPEFLPRAAAELRAAAGAAAAPAGAGLGQEPAGQGHRDRGQHRPAAGRPRRHRRALRGARGHAGGAVPAQGRDHAGLRQCRLRQFRGDPARPGRDRGHGPLRRSSRASWRRSRSPAPGSSSAGFLEQRIRLGAGPPLNVNELQDRLQLLLQDPTIVKLDAQLLPGSAARARRGSRSTVEEEPERFSVDGARGQRPVAQHRRQRCRAHLHLVQRARPQRPAGRSPAT